MNRPLNEDASIPTREEIAARLATKRGRESVVGRLNAIARDCLAVGRKDAAADVLALGDLYAAAEHPYQTADAATKARWRHLRAPFLRPVYVER